MRISLTTIVSCIAVFALCSGMIGCKSNGGPWYKTSTYTFSNPLSRTEAPAFQQEEMARTSVKPHLESQPNLQTPPGGYKSKESQASFAAENGQKVLQTQYQHQQGLPAADGVQVASNPYMGTAVPSDYQQTNFYQPQMPVQQPMQSQMPMQQPMQQYPPGVSPVGASSNGGYPTTYPNPNVPAGNYAPFSPASSDSNVSAYPTQMPGAQMPRTEQPNAALYGNAPVTYGAAAETPYPAQASLPQGGYVATPSTVQANPYGGY
ncbi:MAG: hypothetical protein ACRCUY_06115 [Thermoguttaceae bacterium]